MTIHYDELLKAAEIVVECKQAKVTLKYSLVGSVLTAGTAFVGGLIAGPIGLVIGATSGSLLGYKVTKDKFKSLVTVLREDLTPAQKEKLANHIQDAIKDFGIEDAIKLIAIVQAPQEEAIRFAILGVIKEFAQKELQLSIC